MNALMNKRTWIGLGAAFLLVAGIALVDSFDLLSGNSGAEGEPKGKIVSVIGEGSVTVKPDVAKLSVGVDTSDADAGKAQTQNKAAMEKLVAVLKGLGIAEEDIRTVNYSVWKGIDYSKEPAQQVELYHVNNMVEVTINDITKAGTVLDACAAEGANAVNGLQFSVKDKNAPYQKALEAAMKQAEAKAAGIMGTFGEKPAKPWKVTEQMVYDTPVYAAAPMEAKAADGGTPILGGELQVKAQVIVEYDY